MSMTSKTMEFENSVYKYDYSTKILEVRIKFAGGKFSEPFALNSTQIRELKEALAGIGQQVPDIISALRKLRGLNDLWLT